MKTDDSLKNYYGETLKSNADLQTNACCVASISPDPLVRRILPLIDDNIIKKFYGCGSPIPHAVEAARVLDLGCGSGRDVYILSKLVGPKGAVTGVDMTPEQLSVARAHVESQTRRFGYNRPNVDFRLARIEDLKRADIKNESIDVVVSNCVINLSSNKAAVFKEIFRCLKPGGELYFSDVFADRRIPESLTDDPVLRGECLSGAMYFEDFRRIMSSVGFLDFRVCSNTSITIDNEEIESRIGMVGFSSMTIRAFKLDSLEDICEDYGQSAIYLGTIPGYPHRYALDNHHLFTAGKPMLVCGNTAAMVSQTRLASHFRVIGDTSTHFGRFDCDASNDRAKEHRTENSCC